jgi:hypothetical protein
VVNQVSKSVALRQLYKLGCKCKKTHTKQPRGDLGDPALSVHKMVSLWGCNDGLCFDGENISGREE